MNRKAKQKKIDEASQRFVENVYPLLRQATEKIKDEGFVITGAVRIYHDAEGEVLIPVQAFEADEFSTRTLAIIFIANGIMDEDDIHAVVSLTIMKRMNDAFTKGSNKLYHQVDAKRMSEDLRTQLEKILDEEFGGEDKEN